MSDEKIVPQWSCCATCLNSDTEKCSGCTEFHSYGKALICGIPCGAPVALYTHKFYKKKGADK